MQGGVRWEKGNDDLKSNEGEQQLTNVKTDPAASTFLLDLDAQKTMLKWTYGIRTIWQ